MAMLLQKFTFQVHLLPHPILSQSSQAALLKEANDHLGIHENSLKRIAQHQKNLQWAPKN